MFLPLRGNSIGRPSGWLVAGGSLLCGSLEDGARSRTCAPHHNDLACSRS
jgi:hypothetical protein